MNPILDTDSYKFSHFAQYPPNTTSMFSYLESRGGRYDKTLFFGLQLLLKSALQTKITNEMVYQAAQFAYEHRVPFNEKGWLRIVKEFEGKLPVRIRAVPEGSVIPTHNVLMTVESTDPETFWVVGHIETMLMRIWYPITVATQSWHVKKDILNWLKKTSENPSEEINFKLHDFGSRGVSSAESAGIGGAAHLVNFMGSDTVMGVLFANKYYNCVMSGFSIPAAEHSTITSWGKEHEVDAYRNMLTQFAKPGSLVAVVSDSYHLANAVDKLWGEELKSQVINSGATLVVRPDSGHPATIVKETLERLEAKFGSQTNALGYKVLNHVRVIQGDGVNQKSINEIYKVATDAGFSATNVNLGMGGALLQQVDRDTQKFAYKCSSVTANGAERDVFKDPITDPGKKSKAGRLDLENYGFGFVTNKIHCGAEHMPATAMQTVYENGELKIETTLQEVRARSNEALSE